ncbi:MAG: type IV secretion system protein VirB4, partial [Gammaproteobacteria bacterium]|nr:type IV secretion system protein VirB4 [Gammaproteobacteria bacterium]
FFSGQKDGIRFSRYTTISMDDILAYPEPARAFLNYLFYRIEHSLDGEPTMIYIEEAWFAFEDPIFSQRLKEWLKRLAKLNVIVVMATQSVFEAEGTKAFASIIDNVPTLIMLPHRRATAFTQFYLDNFQFSPEQTQRLTELTQKSDYYVVQNGDPKVLKCR